jgi:hypothetical protein
MPFASIPGAPADIREWGVIFVVEDEARENDRDRACDSVLVCVRTKNLFGEGRVFAR